MSKKMALGKGLGSLISDKIEENINLDERNLKDIEIGRITANSSQPRKEFNQEDIEALSLSIKRNGVLQPLILREILDGYEIIAGERRFRAAKLAGLRSVPAVIMNPDDQKNYEIALIENMQRVDLNPLEEAYAFNTLLEKFNLKHADIANIVGKSRSYVTNSIRLLQLDNEVQNALIHGKISSGHAKVLITLPNGEQKRLLSSILKDNLSVRELEKSINQPKNKQKMPYPKDKVEEKHYQPFIEQLQDFLGTKVDIQVSSSKGKLLIDFYSDNDFERIFSLIKNA